MYNSSELQAIDLNYFVVCKLLQDEELIEIQSKNTLDTWIIKKERNIREKYPIVLYHKHENQRYFHRHWQCYKVSQAVKSILEHDSYVLRLH